MARKPGHGRKLASSQRGATLVVALVILVLIMMIGIAAVSTSDTQSRLAANLQFEDVAMNNAEAGINEAEGLFASKVLRYSDPGFVTRDAVVSPHLYPRVASLPDFVNMTWNDTNSRAVGGDNNRRYMIHMMSQGNKLLGSDQGIGDRPTAVCSQVNTYLITARGDTARGSVARGSTKYVQSYYSVLSCPS